MSTELELAVLARLAAIEQRLTRLEPPPPARKIKTVTYDAGHWTGTGPDIEIALRAAGAFDS